MLRITISFIGGFLLGVLSIWIYDASFVDDSLTQLPEIDGTTQNSADPNTEVTLEAATIIATLSPRKDATSQISVRDQESGSSVQIDIVTLNDAGWVVVHEENGNAVGNALGALRRDAGSYEDLSIPLLRETLPGSRYFVVIYNDNGDQEFSLESDFPARDESGQPITAAFFAQ